MDELSALLKRIPEIENLRKKAIEKINDHLGQPLLIVDGHFQQTVHYMFPTANQENFGYTAENLTLCLPENKISSEATKIKVKKHALKPNGEHIWKLRKCPVDLQNLSWLGLGQSNGYSLAFYSGESEIKNYFWGSCKIQNPEAKTNCFVRECGYGLSLIGYIQDKEFKKHYKEYRQDILTKAINNLERELGLLEVAKKEVEAIYSSAESENDAFFISWGNREKVSRSRAQIASLLDDAVAQRLHHERIVLQGIRPGQTLNTQKYLLGLCNQFGLSITKDKNGNYITKKSKK